MPYDAGVMFVFRFCFVLSMCLLSRGMAAEFPASRPEKGPVFDFTAWRAAVRGIDFKKRNGNHPGPWGGWFSPDNDECAEKYVTTWGPLGIRTRMHDPTWGHLPAFRRAWPKVLLDADGELAFPCFEVVSVSPDSPADGHLLPGDLLLAMDGRPFRTALALRPDNPAWQHQGARSLEMDAGERLDLAEGRGRVSFDVVRMDAGAVPQPAGHVTRELFRGPAMPREAKETDLDVEVGAGQEVTVALELTGNGNGSCGADFLRPRLEGASGTLPLHARRRVSEANGWAQIREGGGKEDGKDVAESIWFHAPAHLSWVVPSGFGRIKGRVVCPPGAAGYQVVVKTRISPKSLPPALASARRVVSFSIPKIGSYGRGFPFGNDAKSAMVAKMTAAWLVDHQQSDGSWPRNVGYTHNGYDTAWAGLGLLAHGDPAHADAIRRAAEFIAFRCPQDGWAVPSSVMVMFLSEYWLRTHDDRILVALQSQVERLRGEMVYGDWNGGHGHNPGYGGSGVSTGGSHMALAFALADLTPAKAEEGLTAHLLARAQELAPDGFIPYGRSTETRSFVPNLEGGGTYSGRHGPYLVASMIHGGPKRFTENCRAMYERGAVGGIARELSGDV